MMCIVFQGLQVQSLVEDLTKTGKFQDMNYTFWDEYSISKVIRADCLYFIILQLCILLEIRLICTRGSSF